MRRAIYNYDIIWHISHATNTNFIATAVYFSPINILILIDFDLFSFHCHICVDKTEICIKFLEIFWMQDCCESLY